MKAMELKAMELAESQRVDGLTSPTLICLYSPVVLSHRTRHCSYSLAPP
jgi:hypothetical protein